jgi:small subunit ribosomal protein S11
VSKLKKNKVKKRVVKVNKSGNANIHASFNNIIISMTNELGQVISWASAGSVGFKGAKKNTPFAAQKAADSCAKVAYDLGIRKVDVYIKGPGVGRETAVRAIKDIGIAISTINDVTPIPHNGCRPPKIRRP